MDNLTPLPPSPAPPVGDLLLNLNWLSVHCRALFEEILPVYRHSFGDDSPNALCVIDSLGEILLALAHSILLYPVCTRN